MSDEPDPLDERGEVGARGAQPGGWSTFQLLLVAAVMLGVGWNAGAGSSPAQPSVDGETLVRPFPVTATEVRMQNMCREAIADRRIRGSVDEAAASAVGLGRDVGFEDTPWARADAGYAIGDWEKGEPAVDWVVVGSGEARELQGWRMQAHFGAGAPGDPGALVGRVWCLLIVDPETEEVWFRRTGRDPGEDPAKHFWLEPGAPEALVMMEYLP